MGTVFVIFKNIYTHIYGVYVYILYRFTQKKKKNRKKKERKKNIDFFFCKREKR